MSVDDKRRLRLAAAQAAAPGLWLVNPVAAQVDEMNEAGDVIPVCRLLWPTKLRTEQQTEDLATFISNAKEDVESLLATVDRYRAALDRSRTRARYWRRAYLTAKAQRDADGKDGNDED